MASPRCPSLMTLAPPATNQGHDVRAFLGLHEVRERPQDGKSSRQESTAPPDQTGAHLLATAREVGREAGWGRGRHDRHKKPAGQRVSWAAISDCALSAAPTVSSMSSLYGGADSGGTLMKFRAKRRSWLATQSRSSSRRGACRMHRTFGSAPLLVLETFCTIPFARVAGLDLHLRRAPLALTGGGAGRDCSTSHCCRR